MDKRGQITVFVIIGLVILLTFGFVFLIRSQITENIFGSSYLLSLEKASLEEHVDSCFESTLKKGYQQVGLDKERLESYINVNLYSCVDLSSFEDHGLEISKGNVSSSVSITDKIIFADVDFLIILSREDSSVEVSEFIFTVKRSTSVTIPTDENGVVIEDIVLLSSDSLVELDIPKGTQLLDENGQIVLNPTIHIKLSALDSRDATIHGYRIYRLEPSGIRFSQPITIRIMYDDNGIGNAEASLKIVKRRDSNHMWKTIPTTVYTDENVAVGSLNSFSEVGISITCGNSAVNDKLYLDTEFMYIVNCEPCNCFMTSENGALYSPYTITETCAESEGKANKNRCGVSQNSEIKYFNDFELHEELKGGTTGYMPYREVSNFVPGFDIESIKENCLIGCDEGQRQGSLRDDEYRNCIDNCGKIDDSWSGCKLYDWDGDGEQEYGYPSATAAGGNGEFRFNLEYQEGAGKCVNDINIYQLFVDDAILEFKLFNRHHASPIDVLALAGLTVEESTGVTSEVLKAKFNDINFRENLKEKIVEGENTFTIKVKNTHGACSFARMLFEVNGNVLSCDNRSRERNGKCCETSGGLEHEDACPFPVSDAEASSGTIGIAMEEGSEYYCSLTYEDYCRESYTGLSLAPIKSSRADFGVPVLNKIAKLLETEGQVDLILTPEYTFYESYAEEHEPYDVDYEILYNTLILEKTDEGYEVDPSSHSQIRFYVKYAQELAAKYKSNIFLGTFAEEDSEEDKIYNTLLYINSEGKIIARKRKFHPPEEEFVITASNGKSYKVLPLICGEAWHTTSPSPDDAETAIPEWVETMVNQYGRFDIIIHSLAQADMPFDDFAEVFVQEIRTEEQLYEEKPYIRDMDFASWIRNVYHDYYDRYMNNINSCSPMVISDIDSIAAVLNPKLKPFEKYIVTEDYVLVRI